MATNISTIPFEDFGGNGPVLHFAHANAYPPASYKQLLAPFTKKYRVMAMHQRPLWEGSEPKKLRNWSQLADDFILFAEQQKLENIVGMGHSMGGVVSILAALKNPKLFSKLILIDPVVIPNKFNWFMPLLPDSIRKKVIPIAKISEKRKDIWSDKEGIFASYRKKRVFKHFSDTALQDFIDAAIKPTDNQQYTLTYPKSWETQVYITAPSIFKKLTKVQIPIIAIKGAHSNVITDEIWEKWQKAQPQNEFLEYPNSGHLVPLEYPNEIASWIMERL